MEGGRPGKNGAYEVSSAGVLTDAGTGEVMIQTLDKPADQDASVGYNIRAARAPRARRAAAAGAAFFGGGGGGAGVDAGGGGGGSAFVNESHVSLHQDYVWGAQRPPQPFVVDANHTAVSLQWPMNDFARTFLAERYHVEMALGI